MLLTPTDYVETFIKEKTARDLILLWQPPDTQARSADQRLPDGAPYRRCYARLQSLNGRNLRVFFSEVQADPPALEDDVPWLATLLVRAMGLNPFGIDWFLHIPAGLRGGQVDTFRAVEFDWTGTTAEARNPRWHEVGMGPLYDLNPVELPGLYESDKDLMWATSYPAVNGYGLCRPRIWEEDAGAPAVILSDLDVGLGASSHLASIASWLRAAFELDPAGVRWVTHHVSPDAPDAETFRQARLTGNGVQWQEMSSAEGHALLARARSFQLPLGPVVRLGDPRIAHHLALRKGQGLGKGKTYAADDVYAYGNYAFVHEDGQCRRLVNVYRDYVHQCFHWGDDSRGAGGLAYSILADLLGEGAAEQYWRRFLEDVIVALPAEEAFTLTEREIRGWLDEVRRAGEGSAGIYLN